MLFPRLGNIHSSFRSTFYARYVSQHIGHDSEASNLRKGVFAYSIHKTEGLNFGHLYSMSDEAMVTVKRRR